MRKLLTKLAPFLIFAFYLYVAMQVLNVIFNRWLLESLAVEIILMALAVLAALAASILTWNSLRNAPSRKDDERI